MPSFRKPAKQARHALQAKVRHGEARHGHTARDRVHSVGYERNLRSSLTQLSKYLGPETPLRRAQREQLDAFLQSRRGRVGQKQLDTDRRAIEIQFGYRPEPLESAVAARLGSRAYGAAQVRLVMQHQSALNALSTELAWRCGLRSHELFSIRPAAEQPASAHRRWSSERFTGASQGVRYTVRGKGGLVREVLVPADLATRLEAQRLAVPRPMRDREIEYLQHYGLCAGQSWARSFSRASVTALGWTSGAHGLRHTYAQSRMDALQRAGYPFKDACLLVSQELGHFRADVVLTYLR